jgi:hypothetical protein
VNQNIPSCRPELDRNCLLWRCGYPSILAESQNQQCLLVIGDKSPAIEVGKLSNSNQK